MHITHICFVRFILKHLVSAVNEIVLKTYHTTHDVVDVEHQIVIALYNVQALP